MDVRPLGGVRVQEAPDEVLGRVGDGAPDVPRELEGALLDQLDQIPDGGGIKRLVPAQHDEQDAPGRPQVDEFAGESTCSCPAGRSRAP